MRKLVLMAAAAGALALPASAPGGGWATVGIAPMPTGVDAGDRWTPTVTVLQHGRTPLDGVSPAITIRNDRAGVVKTFPASPTGEPGKYRAEVVFPTDGRWAYTVDDGFGGTHTFAPVTVQPPGDGVPVGRWVLGTVAALAGAAVLLAFLRRRRDEPAVAAPARG